MIHMAQRILLPTARLYAKTDVASARRLANADADVVRRGPAITIDAVADYFATNKQGVWSLADCPNCAPPFKSALFQWTTPKKWHNAVDNLPIGERPSQEAIAMTSVDLVTDDIDVDAWLQHLGHLGLTADRREAILASRWVISLSHWMAWFSQKNRGEAAWLGLQTAILVDANGRATEGYLGGPGMAIMNSDNGVESGWSSVFIALLAISFMHCKNITVEDETISLPPEKWHRRQGIPIVTHKVLNIAPMREVLRREGGSDEVGGKRALHICRGHFSTYTDAAPLFGRVTGTFWVPQHVRGTKEAGEVVKDYEIRD